MPGLFDGNFGGMQGGNAFPGGQRPAWGGGNPGWAGGLQSFMQHPQMAGMQQAPGMPQGPAPMPQGATNLTPPTMPQPGGQTMYPGGAPGGPPQGPQQGSGIMQPGGSPVGGSFGGQNNVADWMKPNIPPGGQMQMNGGAAQPGGQTMYPGGNPGDQLPQGATNLTPPNTGIGAGGGFANGLKPYVGQVGNSRMMA